MIKIQKRIWILLIVLLSLIPIVTAPIWYGTSTSSEDNLVGHWACEGNFDDSSGEGNDGTQTGGVSIGTGYKGRGCEFDGVDDYVNCGSDASLDMTDELTLSAWVYNNGQTDTRKGVVGQTYYGESVYGIGVDNSAEVSFLSWNSVPSTNFTTGDKVPIGEWTHLAITVNSSNVTIVYVNGVNVKEYTLTTRSFTGGDTARIGITGTTDKYFDGTIDEVRIYNTSLTAAEISNLYNSTKSYHLKIKSNPTQGLLDESGLIAHWDLNGDATDKAGSYDATVDDVILTNEGRFKEGYVSDGIGDSLYVMTDDFRTANATWAGWFKLKSPVSTAQYILSYQAGGTSRYAVYAIATSARLRLNDDIRDEAQLITWAGTLADFKWHHVAVVLYENGTKRAYFDGVADVVDTDGGNLTELDAGQQFTFGAYDETFNSFNGTVDEVRIYNRSLSAAEVADLYNGTKSTHFRLKSTPQLGILNETPAPTLSDESGLVGHWKLNTDALDSSGEGNDGTIAGINNATGRWNEAYSFDGVEATDQHVKISSIPHSQNFTISAWIYPISNPSYATIVSHGYPTCSGSGISCGWEFYRLNTGNIILFVRNGTAPSGVSVGNTPLNQWSHVVATFVNSTKNTTIYINGVLKTFSTTGNYYLAETDDDYVKIGARISGASGSNIPFNGSIDEVRIYNRSLSADEIKELYVSKGLVGHWSFDSEDGSNSAIAPDISGYNNSGTVTGATFTNQGRFKEGYEFDGEDDFIDVGSDTSLDNIENITVSVWLNTKGSGTVQEVVQKNSGLTTARFLYFDQYKRIFTSRKYSTTIASAYTATNAIVNNRWYHIVSTINGGIGTIYLDGVDVTSLQSSNGTGTLSDDSAGSLKIGQVNNGYWFNGTIDDVKIFARALTASEIGNLYNGTKSTHLRFYSVAG